MIILGLSLLAASTVVWRALIMENELTVENQVDYEDAALCIKFGFAHGTARHDACKLDLLDLRRSHEDLLTKNSLP
jgi:hypothetical protein